MTTRGAAIAMAVAAAMAAGPTISRAMASVLVVGDSLGVGTAPALRDALPDVSFEIDARNGRTSSEGVRVLEESLRPDHETVVFDLGTNDGPPAAASTAANLASARELAAGRCLVVATLNHPPTGGVSVGVQNSVIRDFASKSPSTVLADWHRATAAPEGLMRSDGVHATASGYDLRARVIASAVLRCITGRSAPRAGGRAASRTRRPADRRARSARSSLAVQLVGTVTRSLAGAGVLELAMKVSEAMTAALGSLSAAVTPRGPEPVLGAPPP
jgi:lysophospholipase L1-like esterase